MHHEDVQRGRLTRRPQHVDQILDVNRDYIVSGVKIWTVDLKSMQ